MTARRRPPRSRRPSARLVALAAAALVLLGGAPALALPAEGTPATGPGPGPVPTSSPPAPPTPLAGPSIAPEHAVGGPELARSGVVVDLPAGVPAPPELQDVSYVLADMTSGQVLAAKSPHALLPPASTLKALTSLVLLPALDPNRSVTATPAEVAAEGTRVGLVPGNPYTVDTLFYGLVLVSGNDTAYALADAFGGRTATLAAMNAAAARLGAWDTLAKDPSGLDADGQRSSAYDLALIGRALMQVPRFQTYATTRQVTFPGGTDPSGKVFPPFNIQNHNKLLWNYDGTIGVKNGYTTGARHTFIGAVTRGGRSLIIAQMGSLDPSWRPTAAMLDWGFAYGGQVRPVGTLVAPGTAPQPPEWQGGAAPVTTPGAGSPPGSAPGSPPGTGAPAIPAPGGPPRAAAEAPAPVSLERTVATAFGPGGQLRRPPVLAALALVLAAGAGLAWARRRRH